MCYTQQMSAGLALAMFCVAAYEHKAWRCWHYTLGLIYFGLMEGLQAIQHAFLAVPEDNYSMCESRANQSLTWIGGLHICYQPFFFHLGFVGLYRRNNLRDRIESDIILKLCLLASTWWMLAYTWANYTGQMAPPATKECPDYGWMRDGYDEALDFVTPNLPGKACTYLSPSKSGHLAWVFPKFHESYYQPAKSLHSFLFYAPHFSMLFTRPVVGILAIVSFFTGPMFVRWITPDVNEQPAIWCFGSVTQCISLVVIYRLCGVPHENAPSNENIVYEGKLGEAPIIYQQIQVEKEEEEGKYKLLTGKEDKTDGKSEK